MEAEKFSDQELRRSGRSTRRASFSNPRDFETSESNDDSGKNSDSTDVETKNYKKSRRYSMEDNKRQFNNKENGDGVTESRSEDNEEENTDTERIDEEIDEAVQSQENNMKKDKYIESKVLIGTESKHSTHFGMSREAFIKDLYSFMQARGQPISKLPSLGYQELNLYLLYQLVIARGGMDEVTRKQEWKLVYQDLGIPTMSTSASYNTRTNYKKYLYLYELEHCGFPDKNRPKDTKTKYQIGAFIRIISSVFEGQVFYARILKFRYRDGKNQYYVHYNGWNSSHDEWMNEEVLDPLLESEKRNPESLPNPPPSRSSKSNHLIFDPTVSEKVLINLVASAQKSPRSAMPLSPTSPAQLKKHKKNELIRMVGSYSASAAVTSSEEEEAANELLGFERFSTARTFKNIQDQIPRQQPQHYYYQQQNYQQYNYPPVQRPVEILKFPMRPDPGDSIAKILEDKRDRLHEQDVIHRTRLHTHVVMGTFADDCREREMVAKLLSGVKLQIETSDVGIIPVSDEKIKKPVGGSDKNKTKIDRGTVFSGDDPRSLHDIQESLVSLQSSLLATQTSFRQTMRALKKHHGVQVLPPLPPPNKKTFIGTRRSERA